MVWEESLTLRKLMTMNAMKTYWTLLVILLTAAMPVRASYYLVGNAPFGGWQTNAGLELTLAEGTVYTAEADVTGTVWFVVASQLCSGSSDWTEFASYRMGPTANGTVVSLGTPVTAQTGMGDNSFKFTGSGTYTFSFDASSNQLTIEEKSVVVIDPLTGDLFVLGEADGNVWDPSVGVQLETTDGSVFTGTVTFNGEHTEEGIDVSYFALTTKLATSSTDWSGIVPYRLSPVSDGNFYVTTSQLDTPISLNAFGTDTDLSFRIPQGTYTLTVDLTARTCTIHSEQDGSSLEKGRGWPSQYGGVMLQGFYWDSYERTKWSNLTDLAPELGQYFDIIWVPNSGRIDYNGTTQSMGYTPVFWLSHNSCFGTETQLRQMISTYRKWDTSMMAEMVINHKNGEWSWTDFPAETVTGQVTGKTYSLTWSAADICQTDECVAAGYSATGAADEGDDFDGARDLDHTSSNVQQNVKTYEDYLLNELGYDGFRYDMSKGYAAYYTGLYNQATQPVFSVGEYWDGDASVLRTWLDGTKKDDRIMSAVFDFALKYKINEAFGGSSWGALSDKGLSADVNYQRYAVTFIDNHDTGSNSYNGKLEQNVMAANAFLLTMPGTPCIFLKHYQVYAREMQQCIRARRAAGVHNQSSIVTQEESNGGYIVETQGTHGRLYLQLGGATANGTPSGYTLVQSGDNYKLFITSGIDWAHVGKDGSVLGHPVVSRPGGTYAGNLLVNVAPSDASTTLVYTTDGSVPTAQSTLIDAATTLPIVESTTLRVGVLCGERVENVETYVYTLTDTPSAGVNVYVQSTLSSAHLYAWNETGTLSDAWPGTALSSLDEQTVDGITWRRMHFDTDSLSLILNDNYSGFQNQTATLNVTRDTYLTYPVASMAVSSYGYTAADTYADVTSRYGLVSDSSPYMRGDANNDHTVTIADVAALVRHLLTGETVSEVNADGNVDLSLTLSDVQSLVSYLLNEAW